MINLESSEAKSVSLRASNIVHYASWVPGRGLTVAYSTVEPRATAPGWQANNDLILAQYSPSGIFQENSEVIPANTAVFGWWGTSYASHRWNASGPSRQHRVGRYRKHYQTGRVTPYQTSGLGLGERAELGSNHQVLYYLNHPPKSGQDNLKPLLSSTHRLVIADRPILAPKVGCCLPCHLTPADRRHLSLAYLQAIFPEQSDTRRYRLFIVDAMDPNRTTSSHLKYLDWTQQIVWST
jgi:hypothetical protein